VAFIDDHGRLFGRFNLVDVVVALAVLLILPLGYAAYRVFRTPSPIITGVTPTRLAIDAPRRVRLSGQHFRPYLGAFVSRTDEPYSVVNRLPNTQQATFLIQTPTLVELALPPVGPGTYDIHLYDEAQEVANLTAAFTIAAPQPGTVEALVRFVVPPEMASLVKAGDRDRWEENGVAMLTPSEAAVMESVRVTSESATITTSAPPTPATAPGTVLQGTVRITAKQLALGGWEYKSSRVRAGETFIFETIHYRISGVILRTTDIAAPVAGGQ
jgi:hypothetical protein